jgi:hypothetical protein
MEVNLMKFIEISISKCKLFLSEEEILYLLKKDMGLFKEGILRGKAIMRSDKQRERESKMIDNY